MRARDKVGRATEENGRSGVVANAIVSYNLRVIREAYGWTQQGVAGRLARLTGHELPQASISAMERGFDGERRRRFDAHELYLLSVVFEVPIAYFFVPPPEDSVAGKVLADTRELVCTLYAAFLGCHSNLGPLDDRLARLDVDREGAQRMLATLFGLPAEDRSWVEHYRVWRDNRLRRLAARWGDELAEAAGLLSKFARDVQALGPEVYLCGDCADDLAGLDVGAGGDAAEALR